VGRRHHRPIGPVARRESLGHIALRPERIRPSREQDRRPRHGGPRHGATWSSAGYPAAVLAGRSASGTAASRSTRRVRRPDALKLGATELQAGRADADACRRVGPARCLYTQAGVTALKALSPAADVRRSTHRPTADGRRRGRRRRPQSGSRSIGARRHGSGVIRGIGLVSNDVGAGCSRRRARGSCEQIGAAYDAAGWPTRRTCG